MSDYLAPADIWDAVHRVTYKPGYEFDLFMHPFEGPCLAITFAVPNSYRHGEQQTQCVNVPIPPLVNVDHVWDWLMWRLKTIEMHELCEFFHVDGSPMFDPHSESYWKLRKFTR